MYKSCSIFFEWHLLFALFQGTIPWRLFCIAFCNLIALLITTVFHTASFLMYPTKLQFSKLSWGGDVLLDACVGYMDCPNGIVIVQDSSTVGSTCPWVWEDKTPHYAYFQLCQLCFKHIFINSLGATIWLLQLAMQEACKYIDDKLAIKVCQLSFSVPRFPKFWCFFSY
jgi:hypothetical protein